MRRVAHRVNPLVLALAGVDLGLRVASLVDLARRPSERVHGPKVAWGAALAVVSSAGLLPAAYLLWGRSAR